MITETDRLIPLKQWTRQILSGLSSSSPIGLIVVSVPRLSLSDGVIGDDALFTSTPRASSIASNALGNIDNRSASNLSSRVNTTCLI